MMPHIPKVAKIQITIFPAQYCVSVVGEGGVVQFESIQRKQKHNHQICELSVSTDLSVLVSV